MRNLVSISLYLVLFVLPPIVPVFANSISESELTQLVNGDLKEASQILEAKIQEHPTNAELYNVAGNVYAARAQTASLFSAPGLAKRSLKAYEQAVALAPSNTRYRTSLMQFYAFAPGIVGGSDNKALAQVEEIEKLDDISGIVARHFYLISLKDETGLTNLFSELPQEIAIHPRVRLAKANYLKFKEQYVSAMEIAQELIIRPSSGSDDLHSQLLPYNAMLQAGYIGDKSPELRSQSIAALEKYILEAPETYLLTSKKWIKLHLGKTYAEGGDKDKAKSVLLEAKTTTTDPSLLKKINEALKSLKS